MAFAPSTLAYVDYGDYGERNPNVVHAHLILERIENNDFLIPTPDFDMYVET